MAVLTTKFLRARTDEAYNELLRQVERSFIEDDDDEWFGNGSDDSDEENEDDGEME